MVPRSIISHRPAALGTSAALPVHIFGANVAFWHVPEEHVGKCQVCLAALGGLCPHSGSCQRRAHLRVRVLPPR